MALYTVRNDLLGRVHPRPGLKKMMSKLPKALWPKPAPYGLVLALDVIKGQRSIEGGAREYDLNQGETRKWIDTFVGHGRRGLETRPEEPESICAEQITLHVQRIEEMAQQFSATGIVSKILEDTEEGIWFSE